MVSEFRKKKLLRGFEFMDTDKNGTINKEDFDLVVEKIADARGWSTGGVNYAKYVETKEIMDKIWEGIQSNADTNNDGEVSSDEWIAMWDAYAKNPSPMDFQNMYCKFVFSLLDIGRDNKIDCEEFVIVTTSFGRVGKEEATTAFQKMSKGNSHVSFDEYQELWREYHLSEDPNAPGNFIFGRATV